MSRPSRCDHRTGYAKAQAERRGRPLPKLRLGHLYTSSYNGKAVCSWCMKPKP